MNEITDSLTNLTANLGTERDKSTYTTYSAVPLLSDAEASNMFRGTWLAQKIINIPAEDSTRKWRAWQANTATVGLIEAEEKRLDLVNAVREARVIARLRGGAAIYIGCPKSGDPRTPLDPKSVGKGGLEYITVFSRSMLTGGPVQNNVLQPGYGYPSHYITAQGSERVQIHPSRLCRFVGTNLPQALRNEGGMVAQDGWGDSVLLALLSTIKQSDSTAANIASLIFEANIDVFKLPQFMDQVRDKNYRDKIITRFTLAGLTKGINGALVMDKEEEFERKSATFAQLPEIMDRFLQMVCGGADIPATRMLSQSPAGMSATGESDLRNYYDRVQGDQTLTVGPALQVLDECLIRSATGARDVSIYYVWNSLWQTTPTERATIGKTTADTLKTISDTKLYDADSLGKAGITLLTETGSMPGLEDALKVDPTPEPAPVVPGATKAIGDAAPRTLYVSRKVINTAEIAAWYSKQGVTVDPDLHSTITYSSEPVDWFKMGESWADTLEVKAGGARQSDRLGDAGLVLLFTNSDLSYRNYDMRERGASWDWPDYQPHVTISASSNIDPSTIAPYLGVIKFGPEIFEEIKP